MFPKDLETDSLSRSPMKTHAKKCQMSRWINQSFIRLSRGMNAFLHPRDVVRRCCALKEYYLWCVIRMDIFEYSLTCIQCVWKRFAAAYKFIYYFCPSLPYKYTRDRSFHMDTGCDFCLNQAGASVDSFFFRGKCCPYFYKSIVFHDILRRHQ